MKDKRIEIRMSEEDVRTLDTICTDKGLTRSEFVRTLIHGCTDKCNDKYNRFDGCTDNFLEGKKEPSAPAYTKSPVSPANKIRTSTGLWVEVNR